MYMIITAMGFIFFFISLKKEPKVLFGSMAMVIFFSAAIASGNIEKSYCQYENVTSITATDLFLPQYIFSHTNDTIPVLGVGEWTNITFDQEVADIKQGISHTATDPTNHTFTIMEDGIYNVDFDLDLEDTSGGASNIDVAGRLTFINGSEIIGSLFETGITRQGSEAELSHNFLVSCRAGEQFIFQFIASNANVKISTHGTYGDHPESATILMMKIANLP